MAKSGLTGEFKGIIRTDFIDGNMWRICQKHDNPFGLLIHGVGLIQPEDGFVFDFASIPPPARWIYPKTGSGKDGQYGPAATFHDWPYSYPDVITDAMLSDMRQITKVKDRQHFTDLGFLLGMEIKHVRPTMGSFFFRSVRVGGRWCFGKPNKLNKLRG